MPAERPRSSRIVAGLRTIGRAVQVVPGSLAWLPVVAWMTLITGLSAIPGRDQPGGWWISVLGNGLHAPLFGLLAFWMCLALPRENGWPRIDARATAAVLAGVLAFSVVDEFHQRLVPGRDFSLCDMLTNLTGAACVLWIARYLGRPSTGDGGLAVRALVAIALCFAAAFLTTYLGARFRAVEWL